MKEGLTLFLKITLIFMAIPILASCIFVVPLIAKFATELYPDIALIKYFVFIVFYAAVIPFYSVLYQAFKLLSYINKNTTFSTLSVKALKNIQYAAVILTSLFLAGMPIFYLLGERSDTPEIILIGMGLAFAPIVIAVFAAVLQQLLKNVIDIKSENDLTV